jgi:hypothetical protein
MSHRYALSHATVSPRALHNACSSGALVERLDLGQLQSDRSTGLRRPGSARLTHIRLGWRIFQQEVAAMFHLAAEPQDGHDATEKASPAPAARPTLRAHPRSVPLHNWRACWSWTRGPAGDPSAGLPPTRGCHPAPIDTPVTDGRPSAGLAGARTAIPQFMRGRPMCGERKVSGGSTVKSQDERST